MNHSHAQMQHDTVDTIHWHRFPSHDACAEALAQYVAERLQQAQAERGLSSLVVSGGGTPVPMFKQLRSAALDWSKLTITLADERWVDPHDDDSNEKLVRDHLLMPESRFVPLKYDVPSSQEGARQADKALAEAIEGAFDVVILGMGEDGHTASLFPHHPTLASALSVDNDVRCMAIDNAPKPPPDRITLTAPALFNSHEIIIHITGEEKRAVLEKAVQQGDPLALPIAAFTCQKAVPISVYWAA